MSLISIIMPLYNKELYVADSIESVLNQTYKNFEFIIVNDCSTDRSYEIAEQYSKTDQRIKLISNKHNYGVATSSNIGIKASKGSYIARIDADDIWMDDKLQFQLNYFNNDPELMFLATSVSFINHEGKVMKKKTAPGKYSHKRLKNAILRECIITQSTTMYKRLIIEKVGVYNTDYVRAEDYELWIRIIKDFKSEISEEAKTYYRISMKMTSLVYRKRQAKDAIRIKIKAIRLYKASAINYIYIYPDILSIFKPYWAIKIKKRLFGYQ